MLIVMLSDPSPRVMLNGRGGVQGAVEWRDNLKECDIFFVISLASRPYLHRLSKTIVNFSNGSDGIEVGTGPGVT